MTQLVFDNPVHANGGLIFGNPTEIIETQSRGGAGGGRSTAAMIETRRRQEEALILEGLTLLMMELL